MIELTLPGLQVPTTPLQALPYAVSAGLVSHQIFKRWEPATPFALRTFVLANLTLPAGLHFMANVGLLQAGLITLASSLVYLVTVYTSIFVYRLSWFHPLANFPGPVAAKSTKLWGVWHSLDGKQHWGWRRLHQKYGDFVRTGPNELTVSHVDALNVLHTRGSPWLKGPRYDGRIRLGEGVCHLQNTRDPAEHAKRRRLWDFAFTTQALKDYEPMFHARITQFADRLQESTEKAGFTDLRQWVEWLTFDTMGSIAWGGGLEMVSDGEDTMGVMEKLKGAMWFRNAGGNVPWAAPYLHYLPWCKKELEFLGFGSGMYAKRRDQGYLGTFHHKDLFTYLLSEDKETGSYVRQEDLASESVLIIVAGADTTSTSISSLLYFLIKHQDVYKKLQAEIDETFPGRDERLDIPKLAFLPYLNACVNEALRVQPAVPSGAQRYSPKGGAMLCGKYIPENTAVTLPIFAIHHDPRYFSPGPHEFRPERWIHPEKEERFVKDAFNPFSVGPYSCIGNNLGLQEIRLVAATLVHRFDAHFKPGFDAVAWEHSYNDRFAMGIDNPLPVIVTPHRRN